MSTFDFLSNIQLGEDVKAKAATGGGGVKKERVPTGADLRVFATGAVYPSTELVSRYDLEYRNKGVVPPGNGFDVFKSKDWAVTAALPQAFLIIGALAKNSGKVDLFDQVRYNNDGNKEDKNAGATPMTSVLEQGSPTFGKELLTWLEEVYGVTPNEDGYIDLVIVEAHTLKTANDLYNIPKLIARGDKAGELSYERRESMNYHPLAVAEGHVSAPKKEKATEPAAQAPTQTPVQPSEAVATAAAVTAPAEEELPFGTPEGAGEEPAATADVNAPTLGELWPTENQEVPEEGEAPAEEAGSDLEL